MADPQSTMESQPIDSRGPRPPASKGHLQLAARIVVATVLALVLLHFAVAFGDFVWFVVTCPSEIDYGEGIVLNNALNIAHGREVYNNYHHYPFVVATYPPVYPALCAVGARLFGISFTFGRVLTLLATLAAMVLVWLILRRAGVSRAAAGFGTVLFAASPEVCRWAAVMRVDMVAIALGLAGLYCVMRGGRWLIPAVALLVLAVYTRQSQVAPLAAGVLYLWWAKERRAAVLVAASCAALIIASFLALQVASDGWFYRHVIVANRNLWDWRQLVEVWLGSRVWRFPFLIAPVGAILALLEPGRGEDTPSSGAGRRPERLLVLYFACAMLVSLTAGKVGSYLNYLIEPLAASGLLSGVAYDSLARRLGSPRWRPAWVAAWVLMVVPPAWVLAQPGRPPCRPFGFRRADMVVAWKEGIPLVRRTRGDVLSENTGLLLVAGHRIMLDPHKMTSMAEDGTWDQRPLVRDIERRRFPLIIITWDPPTAVPDRWGTYGRYRWTREMAEAIMRNYGLVRYMPTFCVAAPADAQRPSFIQTRRRLAAAKAALARRPRHKR